MGVDFDHSRRGRRSLNDDNVGSGSGKQSRQTRAHDRVIVDDQQFHGPKHILF